MAVTLKFNVFASNQLKKLTNTQYCSIYKFFFFFISILIILKPIQRKITVCLCTIAKKENLYAKEFIDYYIGLGYDQIFIYDNNDKDDEKLEDVLKKSLYKNKVTIIDYRGFRGERSTPQFYAYYDCYEKNSKNYDWLSFFDFDEFLVLNKYKRIKKFLSEKKFKDCENIKINWILYSDNNLIFYDNRKIQERFTEPLYNDSENKHIKSTVKGNMKINYWSKLWNPHSSEINVTTCISTGEKVIDYRSPFQFHPNYQYAYLKHYRTKTISEFINKIRRGRATRPTVYNEKLWKMRLDYFFQRNKKTKEKLDYIKKILNINYE